MATGDPLGLLVVQAVLSRLQRISKANGYFTDAGETAAIGPVERANLKVSVAVQFSQEATQTDSFGKASGNPQNSSGQGRFILQRTFVIIGQIKSEPADSKGVELEYLLADIKRAVFDGTAFFPAERISKGWPTYVSSQLLQREDGNQFESVAVTGTTTYTEAIGDPANG